MRIRKSMTFCAPAVLGLLWALFPLCPAQESQLGAAEAGHRSGDAQSTVWRVFNSFQTPYKQPEFSDSSLISRSSPLSLPQRKPVKPRPRLWRNYHFASTSPMQ